jgi:hypothetical protein
MAALAVDDFAPEDLARRAEKREAPSQVQRTAAE